MHSPFPHKSCGRESFLAVPTDFFTLIKYPVLDSDVCTLVWELLQGFQGTPHGLDILLHDMGIYFGGLHIGMPHELLDDTSVYTVFELNGWQKSCKAVFSAFAPYVNFCFRKIEVHDTQAQALHKTQTAPIHHFCHQKMGSFHLI